jgi:hypothetical protein
MLALADPPTRITPATIDLATRRTAMDSVEATRRVTANSAAAAGDSNRWDATERLSEQGDAGPCSLSISLAKRGFLLGRNQDYKENQL